MLRSKTIVSETTDENALLIQTADSVTITSPTVQKTGDSNGGDSCNFYGLNAGVLVMGGSVTTITGGTIETSASGTNGVFSYGGNGGTNGTEGDGTTVVISDTKITTTGDGSAFEGSISGNIVNAKGEQVSEETGNVSVTLDDNSSWTLTGDTWITTFTGDAARVNGNGYTLYVSGETMAGIN